MKRCALLLVACSYLLGCSAMGNPCPAGSEPDSKRERCVETDPNTLPVDEDDASSEPDANASLEDDGSLGAPDAGSALDAEVPGVCSDADLTAWRGFHESPELAQIIDACVRPCQEGATCEAESCIREAAGLTECYECTRIETQCNLTYCAAACGKNGNGQQCLACACETGCVARFEACAGTTLDVCRNVAGRDASEDDLVVTGPWLIRSRRENGAFHTTPLTPQPPANADFAFTDHHASGFTHVVPIRLGARHFVLEHKSECGNDPCVARIAPFLRDGSLGRVAYVAVWSRGWDEIESFSVGDKTYLLRYKTGSTPAEDEYPGHLLIEEVVLSADGQSITLAPVLNQPPSFMGPRTWSAVTLFNLPDAAYVLGYSSKTAGTEVEILRIDSSRTPFRLVPVSLNLSWSRGWDVVKSFVHEGVTYILTHKSGVLPVLHDPLGSVRIYRVFVSSADSLTLVQEASVTWTERFAQVAPFSHQGTTYLLLQNGQTGQVALRRLSSAPQQWNGDLVNEIWADGWGMRPIWDVVTTLQGATEVPESPGP